MTFVFIFLLDMLTMSTTSNSLADFDRRSSSPTQPLATIKQQPISPPPYHGYNNGFFSNPQQQQAAAVAAAHYHHHSSHEHSTPSPDNEQISPRSNHLGESSSTSNAVTGATGGTGSLYFCILLYSTSQQSRAVRTFFFRCA